MAVPVITDIRTDMVKVQLDIGKFSSDSIGFFKDPKGHELYASVLEEAQRGCDLHNRQSVEISFSYDYEGKDYTSYEFLFACVERQEENAEGQE